MSTYVRTKRTFHRPDCPALRSAKESAEARVYDWNWPDSQRDFDPWIYGAMVVGRPDCVQPCRRCFPRTQQTEVTT